MESDPESPSVEALYVELRRALRHGARAGQLLNYSHNLIDMLCPQSAARGANRSASVRAIRAEDLIRKGIAEIGGISAEALLIILCLKSGTLDQKLERRRQTAARLLGIQVVTFRRDHHEKLLLLHLAIEVYRLLETTTTRSTDDQSG